VATRQQFLLMLHMMGETYGQKPSSWLLPEPSKQSLSEQIFALDFDATCLTIGAAHDKKQHEDMKRNRPPAAPRRR